MEVDEAGKLRAFREKFGRGWDAERMDSGEEDTEKEESLMDLISGFGGEEGGGGDGMVEMERGGVGKGKGKGKEKGGKR